MKESSHWPTTNPVALRNLASVVVATSTGATTLATIYMFAHQDVRYADFIVGSLAWNPQSKLQDFLALPTAAIFAALAFVVVSRLIDLVRSHPNSEQAESQFEIQLIWWSLPTIAATAGLALNPVVDQNAIQLSVVVLGAIGTLATITLLASCWLQIRRFGDARPESTSLILLGSALCGLAPIALTTGLGRVGLVLTPQPSALIPAVVAVTIAALVGAIWIFDINVKRSRITAGIPILLAIAQLPLALFYAVLWPSTPILSGGEQLPYSTTFWLVALVGGLVVVALFGAARQLVSTIRGRHSGGEPWNRATLALFAPIVYLKWGTSVVPSISPDDFHFGELLLGWWSLTNGYIPYVEYMPPHGIVDDYLGQAFAFIFFDGHASSMGEAFRIATASMAILIYLSLFRLTNSLGIAIVGSIFLAPNGGRFLWAPLLLIVAVLLEPSVVSRRTLWLTISPLLVIAIILLTPTYGIALGLAISLSYVYLVYRVLGEHQYKLLSFLAGTWVLMGIVLIVSPIGRMLKGEIFYLAENAPINTTAYGIAWSESWNYSVSSGLIFEIARMQWAFGLFIAVGLAVFAVSDHKRNRQLIAVSVGSAVFLLALVPYAMGRIDPGVISRPGTMSIVVWTSIIPILLSRYKPRVPKVVIVLVMVVACGSISSQTFPLTTLKAALLPTYSIGAVQDGASIGMPKMGRGVVDTAWWDGKTRLARGFAALKQDKGIYLDLTNRNANYFYLQRLPPTPVTSYYTMVPRSTQKAVVAYLQQHPEAFILAEDDNILHDGGPLSLRAPLVYRSIIDNYVPQVTNGIIFAFRHADYPQPEFQIISDGSKNSAPTNLLRIDLSRSLLAPEPGSRLVIGRDIFEVITSQPDGAITIKPDIYTGGSSVAIGRLSYPQRRAYALALWQRIFSVADVKGIAGSWGSSAESLLPLISNVIELGSSTRTLHDFRETNGLLIPTGEDPGATYLLPTPIVSAKSYPYLTLSFSCHGTHATPQLQVFWWSSKVSASETASIFLNAPDGTLVVPLDSNPAWRLTSQIVGIRVDLANPSACDAITLGTIELRG